MLFTQIAYEIIWDLHAKKKKLSASKILVVVVLIVVVAIGFVGWHDGLIGMTPMGDINEGTVDTGAAVTAKGEISLILAGWITIGDTTDAVTFPWADVASFSAHTLVVVRRYVSSLHVLDASSVERVWLFA
jgi:hypothetical protein